MPVLPSCAQHELRELRKFKIPGYSPFNKRGPNCQWRGNTQIMLNNQNNNCGYSYWKQKSTVTIVWPALFLDHNLIYRQGLPDLHKLQAMVSRLLPQTRSPYDFVKLLEASWRHWEHRSIARPNTLRQLFEDSQSLDCKEKFMKTLMLLTGWFGLLRDADIMSLRQRAQLTMTEVHNWLWDPTHPKYTNWPRLSDNTHNIGKLFHWPRLLLLSSTGQCIFRTCAQNWKAFERFTPNFPAVSLYFVCLLALIESTTTLKIWINHRPAGLKITTKPPGSSWQLFLYQGQKCLQTLFWNTSQIMFRKPFRRLRTGFRRNRPDNEAWGLFAVFTVHM